MTHHSVKLEQFIDQNLHRIAETRSPAAYNVGGRRRGGDRRYNLPYSVNTLKEEEMGERGQGSRERRHGGAPRTCTEPLEEVALPLLVLEKQASFYR